MAVDLSVNFLGVKFKNPFLLSPTPASRTAVLGKAARAGWGGAVPWGAEIYCEFVEQIGASLPHDIKYIERPPAYWTFGIAHHMQGVRPEELCPPERVERSIKKAKESGMPVIANIVGGLDSDVWIKSCLAAERAGADILEINFSYALHPQFGMHHGWPDDPEMTKTLLRAIREKISIPITVKLNAFLIPNKVKNWARACVEGGADAISISNSIPGFSGLDIETGLPRTAFLDKEGRLRGTAYQICDGPGIRPIGLAAVALVNWEVDVPIIAIGGVSDWYSAVEYFMLGASMVQVGSAAMAYGHRMIRDLTRGLSEFMERKGYTSVDELVGIANKKYRLGENYMVAAKNEEQPWTMVVDESRCTGCSRCVTACDTSAHSAIEIADGIAGINQDTCIKCCMCKLVCPEEAVSMVWEPGYAETLSKA